MVSATWHFVSGMTFDFALGQLRSSLEDLADRTHDLAGLSGATVPWLRRWEAPAKPSSP